MKRIAALAAAFALISAWVIPGAAQQKAIRIGVPTAMQLQVGRDTQDALKMAVDESTQKAACSAASWRWWSPTRPKIPKPASARSRS